MVARLILLTAWLRGAAAILSEKQCEWIANRHDFQLVTDDVNAPLCGCTDVGQSSATCPGAALARRAHGAFAVVSAATPLGCSVCASHDSCLFYHHAVSNCRLFSQAATAGETLVAAINSTVGFPDEPPAGGPAQRGVYAARRHRERAVLPAPAGRVPRRPGGPVPPAHATQRKVYRRAHQSRPPRGRPGRMYFDLRARALCPLPPQRGPAGHVAVLALHRVCGQHRV